MKLWRSLFDTECRQQVLERVRSLDAGASARWGKMNAPQMIAHLSDTIRHCMSDTPAKPVDNALRAAVIRNLVFYVLPWPKGKVQGPSEAFLTRPAVWEEDIERLCMLIESFGQGAPRSDWPNHPLFGPMTGRDWGVFNHRHCDHHLRQFGA